MWKKMSRKNPRIMINQYPIEIEWVKIPNFDPIQLEYTEDENKSAEILQILCWLCNKMVTEFFYQDKSIKEYNNLIGKTDENSIKSREVWKRIAEEKATEYVHSLVKMPLCEDCSLKEFGYCNCCKKKVKAAIFKTKQEFCVWGLEKICPDCKKKRS